MPELKNGLLWRIDTKDVTAVSYELERARQRFRERTGSEASVAYAGPVAYSLINVAKTRCLLPVTGPILSIVSDPLLPDRDILLTAEDETNPPG